jgi:hypothetical protein
MYSVGPTNLPGDIMDNTLDSAASASLGEQSALQNARSAAATFKLVLIWLAVSIPMVWGVTKALENVRTIFP